MAITTPKTCIEVSVSALIDASPERIYDLISDVTRMGAYSPETVSAQWIDGAVGPEVGARFVGRNALGLLRWATKPTVVIADRGRCFAFTVPGPGSSTWRYDLQPEGAATRVTESLTQHAPSPAIIRCLQRCAGVTDRAAHLRAGMRTTLDRLALAATAATTADARAV